MKRVLYWRLTSSRFTLFPTREEVRFLLDRGKRPDDLPRGGFRGYFARVSEIRPLHEALGIQTVVLASVEPAISADDESYNQLQGPRRELWLDLLLGVSSDETIVGTSRHLLYVGRKGDGEAPGRSVRLIHLDRDGWPAVTQNNESEDVESWGPHTPKNGVSRVLLVEMYSLRRLSR